MDATVQTVFERYGPLGVLALVFGYVLWVLFKREVARADRMEAEVKRLNDLILDRMLPAVHDATKAVGDALQSTQNTQAMAEALRELRRGDRP